MNCRTKFALNQSIYVLTLEVPVPDKRKNYHEILFSHFSVVPQKCFVSSFIKPFESPESSVKTKIYVYFDLNALFNDAWDGTG